MPLSGKWPIVAAEESSCDHVDASPIDWRDSEFYFSEVRWLKAEMPKVLGKGKLLATVDLSKVDEIGFADLTPGSGHGDGGYSDVGTIEIYGKPVPRDTVVPAK